MFEELALDKPGWKFECVDKSARHLVAELRAAAKSKDREALKIFKTTTGRRRIYLYAPSGAPQKYLVKFYLPAALAKRVKYLVRNSRCRQEYFAAKKLAELKIPAVRAIAFGFRGDYKLPAEELVVEPYLEGIKTLEQLWKESGSEDQKRLFKVFSKTLARMHESGVLQRDFKPDSVLAQVKAGEFELILSDLERIKFFSRPLSKAQRTDNLGKIFQSFLLCHYAPELETLFEQYSKESGLDFSSGESRKLALLSGVRQLKKVADKMQNWADKTNELIEKFDKEGMELRVSRSVGKEALEKLPVLGRLAKSDEIEVSGKRMELLEIGSAKKLMERYFYLYELGVPARAVLFALDYFDDRPGIAGIEIDDAMKTLAVFLTGPHKDKSAEFFTGLGEFLFRLELLGISFKGLVCESILVKKTDDGLQLLLSRPDLLAFDPPGRAAIPVFENSGAVQKLLKEQNLSASQIKQIKQAFDAKRQTLFK
jgi:hypothetical protein